MLDIQFGRAVAVDISFPATVADWQLAITFYPSTLACMAGVCICFTRHVGWNVVSLSLGAMEMDMQ